jgi:hypothetical protein
MFGCNTKREAVSIVSPGFIVAMVPVAVIDS